MTILAPPVFAVIERNQPQPFVKASFVDALATDWNPAYWARIIRATGHTSAQASTNGTITADAAINAETIYRSKLSFNGQFEFRATLSLSQRSANQTIYAELVDVIGDGLAYTINSATSVTVTVPGAFGSNVLLNQFGTLSANQTIEIGAITGAAGVPQRGTIASVAATGVNGADAAITFTVAGWPATGSGQCSLFGWNSHYVRYDGTVATSAKYNAYRYGYPSSAEATVTINTTVPTGHTICLAGEDAYATFGDSTIDVRSVTNRAGRSDFPDRDRVLYLQFRVQNGTVAPTTGTILSVAGGSIGAYSAQVVTVANTKANGLSTQDVNATQNGTWTVQPGNTQNTTPWLVGLATRTTGSTSNAKVKAAATTNGTLVKAGAGTLYGIFLTNNSAAIKYFKLYSKATAPTVGTDAPIATFAIPANGGVLSLSADMGLRAEATGIGYGITGAVGETDTTVTAVDDVTGFISYA